MLRQYFPHYSKAENKESAYLDTAASALKLGVVIESLHRFLSSEYANIHRGAYRASAEATARYEAVREDVAAFIGSDEPQAIVFTSGATDSINLIARSLEDQFGSGDVILLTELEHHSNIVPWQMLQQRRGARIEFAEMTPHGSVDEEDFLKKLKQHRPKLVSFTAQSNSFGSVPNIALLAEAAREIGSLVVVDACQAVVHQTFVFRDLPVDFLVFSGHKLYGPTGVGVLVSRSELLDEMAPYRGGGDMIDEVTLERTTYAPPPSKFEAGTPPIAEVIALGEALRFLLGQDRAALYEHEQNLYRKARSLLEAESGVRLIAPPLSEEPSSIISFNLDGVHSHDLATIADQYGVQIRAGHHCTMPAMKKLGLSGTARLSLGLYSELSDIEKLIQALRRARSLF